MLVETQLALNAADRRDPAGAASWLSQALGRADDLRGRAHGQVDSGQLDVLWLAAASAAIAARRDPALRPYGRWFEVYLPLVGPAPATSAAGASPR